MNYRCPICSHGFSSGDLQQPAGLGGGSYCPKCQGRVYVSFPYGKLVAVVSLLITCGTLLLLHVTSVLVFLIAAAVIWIPLSLFLNVLSTRYKAPTLKKWRERRNPFEPDPPPSLIDKQHR